RCRRRNRSDCYEVRSLRCDIDEGSQASILAEIAPRIFVAGAAILDFADRIQAHERGLHAIAPETQGFLSRSDGARFAAMLVDNDLRFFPGRTETVMNEVDLGLDHSQ